MRRLGRDLGLDPEYKRACILRKHKRITILGMERQSPTAHLNVLRHPTCENRQHRERDEYLSPALHNVPDAYIRYLKSKMTEFANGKNQRRFCRFTIRRRIAHNAWCGRLEHRAMAFMETGVSSNDKAKTIKKYKIDIEDIRSERLSRKVDMAMATMPAVGRNGLYLERGWQPEDWKDIKKQIKEEIEEAKKLLEQSTSTISTLYESIFDAGSDRQDNDKDGVSCDESPTSLRSKKLTKSAYWNEINEDSDDSDSDEDEDLICWDGLEPEGGIVFTDCRDDKEESGRKCYEYAKGETNNDEEDGSEDEDEDFPHLYSFENPPYAADAAAQPTTTTEVTDKDPPKHLDSISEDITTVGATNSPALPFAGLKLCGGNSPGSDIKINASEESSGAHKKNSTQNPSPSQDISCNLPDILDIAQTSSAHYQTANMASATSCDTIRIIDDTHPNTPTDFKAPTEAECFFAIAWTWYIPDTLSSTKNYCYFTLHPSTVPALSVALASAIPFLRVTSPEGHVFELEEGFAPEHIPTLQELEKAAKKIHEVELLLDEFRVYEEEDADREIRLRSERWWSETYANEMEARARAKWEEEEAAEAYRIFEADMEAMEEQRAQVQFTKEEMGLAEAGFDMSNYQRTRRYSDPEEYTYGSVDAISAIIEATSINEKCAPITDTFTSPDYFTECPSTPSSTKSTISSSNSSPSASILYESDDDDNNNILLSPAQYRKLCFLNDLRGVREKVLGACVENEEWGY